MGKKSRAKAARRARRRIPLQVDDEVAQAALRTAQPRSHVVVRDGYVEEIVEVTDDQARYLLERGATVDPIGFNLDANARADIRNQLGPSFDLSDAEMEHAANLRRQFGPTFTKGPNPDNFELGFDVQPARQAQLRNWEAQYDLRFEGMPIDTRHGFSVGDTVELPEVMTNATRASVVEFDITMTEEQREEFQRFADAMMDENTRQIRAAFDRVSRATLGIFGEAWRGMVGPPQHVQCRSTVTRRGFGVSVDSANQWRHTDRAARRRRIAHLIGEDEADVMLRPYRPLSLHSAREVMIRRTAPKIPNVAPPPKWVPLDPYGGD